MPRFATTISDAASPPKASRRFPSSSKSSLLFGCESLPKLSIPPNALIALLTSLVNSSNPAHDLVSALHCGEVVNYHAIYFDPCMRLGRKRLGGEDHHGRHAAVAQEAGHDGGVLQTHRLFRVI